MPSHRYEVTKNGRDHATFAFASDAMEYVESDAARYWIRLTSCSPAELKCRRDEGETVLERDDGHYVDVYPVSAYSVVDALEERRVIGVNGHGHAILERLRDA